MRRSWLEIDEQRLRSNLRAIRTSAGESTEVLAVVKANAYGHGAELCAPALAREAARWFGVTDAAEGARVRCALERAGFRGSPETEPQIVVMSGSLPHESALLTEHRLTPVVWTAAQLAALGESQPGKIQIEIDTGMSRQGARPGRELDALLEAVKAKGCTLDGVFTHLCASEVAHSELTALQHRRFEDALAQLRAHGLHARWVHLANSSAVDNPAQSAAWLRELARSVAAEPMVRTGLALYGLVLPLEEPPAPATSAQTTASARPHLRPALQPVLTWRARILELRDLRPGDTVGYGATFTAPAAMRLALLPVGYADGLRRELSNPSPSAASSGGWVIAHTPDGTPQRCPILGRVSMNLTVVDITAIPTLAPGDAVTLLGEGITAEDHARLAHTLPYEILCGLRATPQLAAQTPP